MTIAERAAGWETSLKARLGGLTRMWVWLLVSIVTLVLLYYFAPKMVKVSLYKLSLLPAATYVLYWLDRALNERRPHEYFAEAARIRAEAHELRKANPVVQDTEYADKLSEALDLEHQGQKRLDRRTLFIAAGMIAVALGG